MMDFVKVRAAAPTVRPRSTALKGLSEGAPLPMKGLRGGAGASPKGPSEKAALAAKGLSEGVALDTKRLFDGAASALKGLLEEDAWAPEGPSEAKALPLNEASEGVMLAAHHSRTLAMDSVAAKTHEPPIQLSCIGLPPWRNLQQTDMVVPHYL
jgi:hypothetical protein